MFTDCIGQTSFSDMLAVGLFSNIVWESPDGSCGGKRQTDTTMISTLRALLSKRMGDGDVLKVSMWNDCSGLNLNAIYPNQDSNVSYLIIDSPYPGRRNDDPLLGIANNGDWGFVNLDKVRTFFSKYMNVSVYVSESRKTSLVFFDDDITIRKWHLLQCAIPAILPWFFKDGISEKEKELLSSLRYSTASDYLRILNEIYESSSYKDDFDRSILLSVGTRADERRRDSISEQLRELYNSMDAYYREIAEIRRSITNKNDELTSVVSRIIANQEDDTVYRIFKDNPAVRLETSSNKDAIVFTVKTLFSQTEDRMDQCAEFVNNNRSVLYDIQTPIARNHLKKLWNAILVTGEIKVRLCACYSIQLGTARVSGIGGEMYNNEVYDTYLPNPHIYHFSCIGGYAQLFDEASSKGDIAQLVNLAIASCSSINAFESCTLRRFAEDIQKKSTKKFMELPGGELVSPLEAVLWLVNKDKEENNNEQED